MDTASLVTYLQKATSDIAQRERREKRLAQLKQHRQHNAATGSGDRGQQSRSGQVYPANGGNDAIVASGVSVSAVCDPNEQQPLQSIVQSTMPFLHTHLHKPKDQQGKRGRRDARL